MRFLPASLVVLSVGLLSVGCSDPPPPPKAVEPPPAVVDAGSVVAPPPAPEQPEPAGIAAGTHKIPAAPKGKGTWAVDPAATSVSFTIVSNSAGPITATFPGGAAGALDAKSKKGVFTVDLTKMTTTNKDGALNPLRDTNVIESFFGARPFANAALKPAVDTAWQKLDGKIASGVAKAGLVVESVEGITDVKPGASGEGVVNGKLVLWDSVEVPMSFPVTVTRAKDVLEVKGTAPATFDIEKATGSPLRKALFDAMIAAGCAHQPGIQNAVTVNLDKVSLVLAKK